MKHIRLFEEFIQESVNIDKVEKYADKVMHPTDVEFTKHFYDQLTRAEHSKEITDAELIGFFKRLAKKKKDFDKFKKEYDQFVVKDERSDINIPFKRRVDQIIAKTVMRKSDFKTSNAKYTFESFLNEFEYGKVLLGDPEPIFRPDRYKELLKIPYEPNTKDENELIDMLELWFNAVKPNPKLGKLLQKLLPLKKKFPKILDPSEGRRNMYEGDELYRGTLMPIEDVLNLGGKWKRYDGISLDKPAIEKDVKFMWTHSSVKGFTSFSPSSEIAEQFAGEYYYNKYGKWRAGKSTIERLQKDKFSNTNIPVILKIKDTHPLALFNPEFTTSISSFLTEYEIILVGKKLQVDGIIIPGWDQFEEAAEAEGFDLNKYFKL